MALSYITIVESTGGLTRKFKAIKMVPIVDTTRTVEKTADGRYNITYGGVYESYEYTLRVPYTSADTAWGCFPDIRTILKRNNPNVNPLPSFGMTDHFGVYYTNCRILNGPVALMPICTIIDGTNTWYTVDVQITMGTTTT